MSTLKLEHRVGVVAEDNGMVRRGNTIKFPVSVRLANGDAMKDVLAPSLCAHEGFSAYFPAVGGIWDDHENEAGKCNDCGVLMIRTTWHTRSDVDFTPMRPEQVERFLVLEDRYRRADQ